MIPTPGVVALTRAYEEDQRRVRGDSSRGYVVMWGFVCKATLWLLDFLRTSGWAKKENNCSASMQADNAKLTLEHPRRAQK